MPSPTISQNHSTQSLLINPIIKIFIISIACIISYLVGSFTFDSISPPRPNFQPRCLDLKHTLKTPSPPLNFQPQHFLPLPQDFPHQLQIFKDCDGNFSNYCPCQDQLLEKHFITKRVFHRERHCPKNQEALRCLVPKSVGYRRPFPWPISRNVAWFNNVPFTKLIVAKKAQNWIRLQGDRFFFPGGGTSFTRGTKEYVNAIGNVVPLKSGNIRTALDVGCGVASFGDALIDFNILTMSIAPRDIHEAQVQFALERGLPAMFGILSTYRLPYPSRSFDMDHCSRCLVPWTAYDGVFLIEIDRVLRAGGYWVLSGPPINWKVSYKGWKRTAKDLEEEQINLESLARHLCWEKISDRGPVAIWRKPSNHVHCIKKSKLLKSSLFCAQSNPDFAWYKKMDLCITPLPTVVNIHLMSGSSLKKWPDRLNSIPSETRVQKINGKNINIGEDNKQWKRRVSNYMSTLKSFSAGMYRNIMDMNSGLGGFAATLSAYPVWVMNVVPIDVKYDTLGIIYDCGLIGTYTNLCEAFSTYPRTYDLIHADSIFRLYTDKCNILDILFEMHRILRPEGVVIIRDHVDVIIKLKGLTDRMKWNGQISDTEAGPFH